MRKCKECGQMVEEDMSLEKKIKKEFLGKPIPIDDRQALMEAFSKFAEVAAQIARDHAVEVLDKARIEWQTTGKSGVTNYIREALKNM